MDKQKLEMLLSKLQGFTMPDVRLEQYSTPSSIAADVLWDAYAQKEIKGKVVADLGCGCGVLGFGACLLGAKKVYFVDVDVAALRCAQENKKILEIVLRKRLPCAFVFSPVTEFLKKVDVVFQNPPFGVKKAHADKVFLERAFLIAPKVYSFHKLSTKRFVEAVAVSQGFFCRRVYTYAFPLRSQFWFHRSKMRTIDVGCWSFQRS